MIDLSSSTSSSSSLSPCNKRRGSHNNENDGSNSDAGNSSSRERGGGQRGGGGRGGLVLRVLCSLLIGSVLIHSNSFKVVVVGGGDDPDNSAVVDAVGLVPDRTTAAAGAPPPPPLLAANSRRAATTTTTTTTATTATETTTSTKKEASERDDDNGSSPSSSSTSSSSSSSSSLEVPLTCQDYSSSSVEVEAAAAATTTTEASPAAAAAAIPREKKTSIRPIGLHETRKVITDYVQRTGTYPDSKSITEWHAKKNKNDPTLFTLLMRELVEYAKKKKKKKRHPDHGEEDEGEGEERTMVSFQLGGMDGKTGDPMYEMSQKFDELGSSWLPVVIEPVPLNFKNLISTYRQHQIDKKLQCSFLYRQLITYESDDGGKGTTNHNDTIANPDEPGKCWFCRYDIDNPECQKKPEWWKHQIASVECVSRMHWGCFVKESYDCDTIGHVLREKSGLDYRHLSVLQIDVEGYEHIVLGGMFDEIEGRPKIRQRGDGDDDDDGGEGGEYPYPPVLNFESMILKKRGQLKRVLDMLHRRGYTTYQQGTVDTLAVRLLPSHQPVDGGGDAGSSTTETKVVVSTA